MDRWVSAMEEGIELVGPDTRGGQRLRQSQAFFAFMAEEYPRLMERWEDKKRKGFQ